MDFKLLPADILAGFLELELFRRAVNTFKNLNKGGRIILAQSDANISLALAVLLEFFQNFESLIFPSLVFLWNSVCKLKQHPVAYRLGDGLEHSDPSSLCIFCGLSAASNSEPCSCSLTHPFFCCPAPGGMRRKIGRM